MYAAYRYIISTDGLDSEASYPFEGQDGLPCRFKDEDVACKIKAFQDITPGNETELTWALANNGPIAVGIDAGQASFQFYESGIYYDPQCSQIIDHIVLLVGYGTLGSNSDYYIAKNR